MMKTLFQWSVWPLRLAASTSPGLSLAVHVCSAGASSGCGGDDRLADLRATRDRAASSLSRRLVRPWRQRDLARRRPQ